MISPFWDGFLLFLIEIAFMTIIGLMYTTLVLLAMWLTDVIGKLINKIWGWINDKRREE